MQKIHLIEQDDLSIDRLMVPQCIANDCPAYKFIEKFFTYTFVMGLWGNFDVIRTCLLHSSANLTMSQALSELLAEETCNVLPPTMDETHFVTTI
jgi:hypothetical protein